MAVSRVQSETREQIDDGKYPCIRSDCDDGPWTSEKELEKHILSNHPHYCEVCGSSFGTAEQRNTHIGNEHDL